jgi:protein-S-isoprenylcysteine O-methyltransferase Ste14
MSILRLAVISIHFATNLTFLVGVQVVFRRVSGAPRHLLVVLPASMAVICELAVITTSDPAQILLSSGLVFDTLGLALFLWTALTTRSRRLSLAFSTDQPDFILAAGPYAHVRHPFYTSYLSVFLGGWIASGSLILGTALVPALTAYVAAARFEERKFEHSPLAGAYGEYRHQVSMFVPWRAAAKMFSKVITAKSACSADVFAAPKPRSYPALHNRLSEPEI